MKTDRVYLRPNIQVEPLVNQWYAWSYLIPPATGARNLAERQLKIMESYISAPQVHAAAVKNPKMLGGPFIDLDGKQLSEIIALRDELRRNRATLLDFSAALGELDRMLASEAKGMSMQPLYAKVPPILRGYVELVYDLNSVASFRLLEPLLYRSRYFQPDAQSFMLSEITGDDRPFVLSTPRLEASNRLHVKLPFRHEAVDELFRMKTEPQPVSTFLAAIGGWNGSRSLIERFFGPDPPPPYSRYSGDGLRWRYFGHACILIETREIAILIDPVLSYTYEAGISRYTYQDLPDRIDYVLITHNHQDHVLLETLLQIRHKVQNIVVPRNSGGTLQDPSLKLLLEAIGFRHLIELGDLEILRSKCIDITGIPFFGEHADLDVRSKLAYLVRTPRHSVLFAADSCNIEPMLYEHLKDLVDPVDALFLGMECDGAPLTWLYGPLLTKRIERAADESRRLAGSNCEQAIQIIEALGCKEVYVYAMGQEPWLNYIMSLKYNESSRPIIESNRLITYCHSKGIVAERLFGERELLLDS